MQYSDWDRPEIELERTIKSVWIASERDIAQELLTQRSSPFRARDLSYVVSGPDGIRSSLIKYLLENHGISIGAHLKILHVKADMSSFRLSGRKYYHLEETTYTLWEAVQAILYDFVSFLLHQLRGINSAVFIERQDGNVVIQERIAEKLDAGHISDLRAIFNSWYRNRLENAPQSVGPPNARNVFISYKWEGETHNKWVAQFAADLRGAGIDAKLDQWEVRYGDSFTNYMTSKIKQADVVLFIITPDLVDAVEAPSGEGGPIKFEMQMATARRTAGEDMRLIGIYRKGNETPAHLRDHRYVDLRDDSKYEQNLKALIDDLLEKIPAPPLRHQSTVVPKQGNDKLDDRMIRIGTAHITDQYGTRIEPTYAPESVVRPEQIPDGL